MKQTKHCRKSWTELLQALPVKCLKRQALFRKKPIRPFNLAWPGFPEIVDCPTQISQNTEGKSDLAEVTLACCLQQIENLPADKAGLSCLGRLYSYGLEKGFLRY